MIEIFIYHSYKDDYFMISAVFVKLKDSFEKERVEKFVKKYKLVGTFVDVDSDSGLKQRCPLFGASSVLYKK
ncbi:hypothetical protein [Bacillus pseudomycoides]|uniref:hypothetical protein n=1 Tax=Bacillus pseudomycoides TaxID=64104 RepID=UPI001FB1A2AE|nr:hypothetical protein [Bacillus pseudomycoides]